MTDFISKLRYAVTAGADAAVITKVLSEAGQALKVRGSLEGMLNRFLIKMLGSTEALITVAKGINTADRMSLVGRVVAMRIKQLAQNEEVIAELRKAGVIFDDSGDFLGNPKALSRKEQASFVKRQRSLMRVAEDIAKGRVIRTPKALDAALESVDDGTRQAILKARSQVPEHPDLETYADALLAKTTLSKVQKDAFTAAIQKAGCQQMADELTEAIQRMRKLRAANDADKSLAEKVQQALEEELKQGASIKNFRERIGKLTPDLAAVVARRTDEAIDMLIDRVLNILIISDEAKAVLNTAFDAEGKRRLFTAMGSFRKLYDPTGALQASENLIGWLFEASKFNKTVIIEQSESFAIALAKVCEKHGFKISYGSHTVHFDVMAPGTKSAKPLQATDHLARVTLFHNGKAADVVSVAGESKGVSGILEGEEQLRALIPRTSGKTVILDGKSVKIGQDLHVHLGEALTKLGIPPNKVDDIVTEMASGAGGVPLKRVVIYPPTSAAQAGLREPTKDGMLRIAHEVTRQQMEQVRNSMAVLFNLFPRRAPADAAAPVLKVP